MSITSATEYFYDLDAASAYVQSRAVDAASLRSEMVFRFKTTNVLQCVIYGHSLLIETKPCTLHAFPTACEFLANGADDIECLNSVDQAIAYILAKNW